MDRAWVVRICCRRLLLAAVLIQALTPDLLDYTLLSQSLPPGPLFVASSLSFPETSQRRGETFFPEGYFALPSAASSDPDDPEGTPGHLCRPIWPELGLTQARAPGTSTRPKYRIDPGTDSVVRIEVAPAVPVRFPPARVAELPLLLCRFQC